MRTCAACGAPIASFNRSGHCYRKPCQLAARKIDRMRKAARRKADKQERALRALREKNR